MKQHPPQSLSGVASAPLESSGRASGTKSTFHPTYGAAFRCIGSECEDTCCQSWGIPLDKTTYEKYQAFPPGELSILSQQYVVRDENSTRDSLYGRINLAPSGFCPFLSAEKLCNIQSSVGADYLSATCSTYPRILNRVDNQLEIVLTLSCPEAARNVLLHQDATCIVPDLPSGQSGPEQSSRAAIAATSSLHKPYAYFHEVRSLLVDILSERTYPIWKRIFVIGMLCKSLDNIRNPESDLSCPVILVNYRQLLATPSYWNEMEAVAAKPDVVVDLVLRLTDQRVREGLAGIRLQECFQSFLSGVGYTLESTPASDTANFTSAAETYYQPFMQAHPHILENYLLNYIFRTLFPFGREASPHYTPQTIFTEYLRLGIQYAWVRGLLIGIAGDAKTSFREGHIIKLVQSFARVVEHNPSALDKITEYLESRSLASVGGVASLFRD